MIKVYDFTDDRTYHTEGRTEEGNINRSTVTIPNKRFLYFENRALFMKQGPSQEWTDCSKDADLLAEVASYAQHCNEHPKELDRAAATAAIKRIRRGLERRVTIQSVQERLAGQMETLDARIKTMIEAVSPGPTPIPYWK